MPETSRSDTRLQTLGLARCAAGGVAPKVGKYNNINPQHMTTLARAEEPHALRSKYLEAPNQTSNNNGR